MAGTHNMQWLLARANYSNPQGPNYNVQFKYVEFKILLTLRNIMRFECASGKIHDFTQFLNILFIFTHFLSIFKDFLAIVRRKVFKSKIMTAQKNPLLGCLVEF